MRKLSIKLRVTIWYTAIMIIISLIALLAMANVTRETINRETMSSVKKAVTNISMRSIDRSGKIHPIPPFMFFENGVHMAIYDENFNLIAGQPPFGINSNLDFVHDKTRSINYNNANFYVYDKKISHHGSTIWVKGVISADENSYALNSALQNNFFTTLILIISAAIGGYLIIRRAFVPVNKISKTAQEISESRDLSRRINISGSDDEIHSLANTFDNMLDKIEVAFEREKEFTSDASHELRTPVSVILSECEYAESCAKTTEEYAASIKSIKRQSEKMSKLISQLLTISRMDKDTMIINFELINISELLSFVCDEQTEIQNPDITLTRDIEENVFATADRFLIARLFINLISNAYSYNRKHGEILVSLKKDETHITFTVKDNGIGISKENLPKIWERFYRADPARSSSDSVGLGLYMVRWIAHAHMGEVCAKSTLGEGSTFVFRFPIKYGDVK